MARMGLGGLSGKSGDQQVSVPGGRFGLGGAAHQVCLSALLYCALSADLLRVYGHLCRADSSARARTQRIGKRWLQAHSIPRLMLISPLSSWDCLATIHHQYGISGVYTCAVVPLFCREHVLPLARWVFGVTVGGSRREGEGGEGCTLVVGGCEQQSGFVHLLQKQCVRRCAVVLKVVIGR